MSQDWTEVTIGDICTKPQYGWTTKARVDGGAVRLLRTTDITSGEIDWSSVPFCTEAPADLDKYLIRENDIVISRAGSVGVSYLVSHVEPAVFASYLIRFRPGPRVRPKYLAHFLKSPAYWKQIADNTSGIAIPNVNATKLQEVRLPLAPIDEQDNIVAEIEKQFSRLDEAVAGLQRVKANLKRYKAAILKAAVAGRLVETEADLARREGRDYETGAQFLQRILATRRQQWQGKGKYKEPAAPDTADLPELPEGWVWATYEAVGRLQLGRQRAPKYHTGPNMRPYLRVQNVFEDRIDLEDVMEMDFPPDDFERYQLFPGDLLLNEGQSPELLGRPAIYRGELPGACFTNTLVRFRAFDGLLVEFALLMSRHYMHAGRFVDEGTITTNIAHLSLGRLACVEFPLPPLPEQHRIVAEVDRLLSIAREAEAEVEANLQRAQALRQAILARAFQPATVPPSATARRASFARPPCSAGASSAPTFAFPHAET